MNVFDWIVLAILAVTLFYGYKTGLVDSVVTVLAIYASLLIGGQFAGHVLSLLPLSVENEALSTPLGYVIIFVAVFIASPDCVRRRKRHFGEKYRWWAGLTRRAASYSEWLCGCCLPAP